MKTLIQVTRSSTVFSGEKEDLNHLHNKFKKEYFLKLPRFLDPDILKLVQKRIQESGFYLAKYKMVDADAADYRLKDKSINSLLRFLMNDEKLFELIEKITGCPKIGSFNGAVFCLSPGRGHYDSWHNDNVDNRMIAVSVNLSTDIFSGGITQIQNSKTKEFLNEVANIDFGDAIVFPLSKDLEHRVTDVEGNVDRIAFPGWFRSKPAYRSMLKKVPKPQGKIISSKSKISVDSIFIANKENFSRIFGEELLIFDPKNTLCYGLSPLTRKILGLLHVPMSLAEIKEAILDEYDVSPAQCKNVVLDLLQRLRDTSLISLHEGSHRKIQQPSYAVKI